MTGRPKLCYVVSAPITVQAFLRPHIRRAAQAFEVSVVANGASNDWLRSLGLEACAIHIPIERRIAPLADLRALGQLIALFKRKRFTLVHSMTPKAGLLGTLAGRAAGVPHRVHTFTGQVWTTRNGFARWALEQADRVIATCATQVLVDGRSQRDFLIAEGIVTRERACVLGDGSTCGVDAGRFKPDAAARSALRARLGIAPEDIVLLYLGRLNREKGVLDLAAAFRQLAERHPDVRLLLVGPDEDNLEPELRVLLGAHAARLHRVGLVTQPERCYPAADIFCLPSYREGFPVSVLEAAACGLPSVASRIYGVTDAVLEGTTGLLHPPRDAKALALAAERLIEDEALRRKMGEAARRRALSNFSAERMVESQAEFYARLLGEAGKEEG